MKPIYHSRLIYLAANYFAYALNFLSGLILARNLGPEQRGTLAFIPTFYLVTLFIVPLNSRNGSSFASLKTPVWNSEQSSFPFKKLYIYVTILSVAVTFVIVVILFKEIPTSYLIYFAISNVTNGLMFYMCFSEGLFRAKEKLFDLAVLRFLGLGIPSFYIFILLALDELRIDFILLSQFFAVMSCFLFLKMRGPLRPTFSYQTYSSQVKKTYAGHGLEYLSHYIIVFTVSLTSSSSDIGYFAVALSFSMVAETFFPLVDSRMLRKIHKSRSNGLSVDNRILKNAIKEFLVSACLHPLPCSSQSYMVPTTSRVFILR
jgi:O-antigen/teichoic acid export membrane protein